MAIACAKILKAFPKFEENQIDVLKERWKSLGFSDQRVIDAVNHVIDTYEGWDKVPNLANFIQFNRYYLSYEQAIERGLHNCEIADKERKLWKRK